MTTIAITMGPLLLFSLGNLTAWRNIALYCSIVQIITAIALCFVSLLKWLCLNSLYLHFQVDCLFVIDSRVTNVVVVKTS